MTFFDHKEIPDGSKIVICLGGGGLFGKHLTAKLPEDTFMFNVDRLHMLSHPRVINVPHDLLGDHASALERIFSQTKRVDVLIHAVYEASFLSEGVTRDTLIKTMGVDVIGTYLFIEAVYDLFWKNGGAHIISIGSDHGNIKSFSHRGNIAAKAALHSLVSALAEHAGKGFCYELLEPGSFSSGDQLAVCVGKVVERIQAIR